MMVIDKTLNILSYALGYGYQRQNVIAHNVANANTPGYKTLDLIPNFSNHASNSLYGSSKIVRVGYTGVTNLDGNNVNIELESMKNVYTVLYTQTVLDFLRVKFGNIMAAISERVG
jgi:flagellar basal body rod protein FlgB